MLQRVVVVALEKVIHRAALEYAHLTLELIVCCRMSAVHGGRQGWTAASWNWGDVHKLLAETHVAESTNGSPCPFA